jgi:predicted TIM-barrel enzyme
VLIGSGITAENARDYASLADGLIVGSAFKEGGYWAHPLDPDRIRRLMHALPS